MPEEWGGQTVTVEVSAKKKQNIELLLEMILLVSDIGELKANPKRSASGTVLEAKLDKGRGPVATVLVQDGTLQRRRHVHRRSDRRPRARADRRSRPADEVGGTVDAGRSARPDRSAAAGRRVPGGRRGQGAADRDVPRGAGEDRARSARRARRLTLESLQAQIAEGGMKELPIIIKADVQGSAEVLADTLAKLSDEKVKIRIIHAGVGAVNESDVLLASASNAIIIAFNVRPDRNAEDIAARERVDIRQHSVIYNVTDEMKKAMTGLLDPTFKEVRHRRRRRCATSSRCRSSARSPAAWSPKAASPAPARRQARLLRDNVVVYEGKIGSLRRFKDDVSEVKTGFECGIGFEQVQRPQGRRRDRGLRHGTGADDRVSLKSEGSKSRASLRIPTSRLQTSTSACPKAPVPTASPTRFAASSRCCSRARCTIPASGS